MKSLKRFFMSVFILIFSLFCFLNTLPSYAAFLKATGAKPVNPFAHDLYMRLHPEHSNLSTRLQLYCGITQKNLKESRDIDTLKQYYILICGSLFNLICSEEDYEEIQGVLKNLANNLLGKDLDEELSRYYYGKEFISLYETAVSAAIPDYTVLNEKETFNLFDVIFVYSYLINLDESNQNRSYLDYIKLILTENGINPENFSF